MPDNTVVSAKLILRFFITFKLIRTSLKRFNVLQLDALANSANTNQDRFLINITVFLHLAMAPYATEDLPHPSLSMSGSSYSSSMDSDYEVHLAQVLHLIPRPVLLPERPASPYDQALPTILVSAKYFTGIENYGNYSFT